MAKALVYPNGTTVENREQAQTVAKQSMEDMVTYLREYAREKPDVAALWCFGIGFILGWKLKPW